MFCEQQMGLLLRNTFWNRLPAMLSENSEKCVSFICCWWRSPLVRGLYLAHSSCCENQSPKTRLFRRVGTAHLPSQSLVQDVSLLTFPALNYQNK